MKDLNGFIMASVLSKTENGVLVEITLNPHTRVNGSRNTTKTDSAKYKLFSHEIPMVGLFDKSLNSLVADFKRKLRYNVLTDLKKHYYPEIKENLKLHNALDYFYTLE